MASMTPAMRAFVEAAKTMRSEYDDDCPYCADYNTPPHTTDCVLGALFAALRALESEDDAKGIEAAARAYRSHRGQVVMLDWASNPGLKDKDLELARAIVAAYFEGMTKTKGGE